MTCIFFRYVRQAIVTVLVPPKFTKRPNLDKPVSEGTELELPCSASGFPIPTIEWTYNGQPITTTTATISINAGTLKIGPVTVQVKCKTVFSGVNFMKVGRKAQIIEIALSICALHLCPPF